AFEAEMVSDVTRRAYRPVETVPDEGKADADDDARGPGKGQHQLWPWRAGDERRHRRGDDPGVGHGIGLLADGVRIGLEEAFIHFPVGFGGHLQLFERRRVARAFPSPIPLPFPAVAAPVAV